MSTLASQRCFNHPAREAAARCPVCRNSFCRECVTEHDGRMMCANCLRAATVPTTTRRLPWKLLGRAGQALTGMVLLWLLFYLLGWGLLQLPSSFHEGTLWQAKWWQSQ